MNKNIFALILGIGLFLLSYKLSTHMIFIGDQAWFYVSARDAIVTHSLPLVGIPTSHPWLHQGPLWTYMLIPVFLLSNFHPASGAYLSIAFGVGSIIGMYYVGKLYFSERVGLIASLLYATSPLIIITQRMPFDPSPIPFFTILFMVCLYKWIKGNALYFPSLLLVSMILYNLEISTILLTGSIIPILFFGLYKKMVWIEILKTRRIITYSLGAFFIPLLPMLMYDTTHGYPQTVKLMAWIGYRILQMLHFPLVRQAHQTETWQTLTIFRIEEVQKLVFLSNDFLAIILFLTGIIFFLSLMYFEIKKKSYSIGLTLLSIVLFLPLLGFLGLRTNSEAYLPILYPSCMLLFGVVFSTVMKTKLGWFISLFLLLYISLSNSVTLIDKNYLLGSNGYGIPLDEQVHAAKNIITLADQKPYIIKRIDNSYDSATMNYEYLTWWLGKGVTKHNPEIRIEVTDDGSKVILKKYRIDQ